SLWFTSFEAGKVSRLTPGVGMTNYLLPPALDGLNPAPIGLTFGPDGKLYIYEYQANRVDRVDTVIPTPPPCMVITQNTTLKQDVGPCAGDGIRVAADNITLNLNGHKVFGTPGHLHDNVGVHLMGRHGVVVTGGKALAEITDFDAGVAIEGGGGNT